MSGWLTSLAGLRSVRTLSKLYGGHEPSQRRSAAPRPTRSRILVTGDSHSRFWAGYDTLAEHPSVFRGVDVLSIGPATAYNAGTLGSSTGAREKITAHLLANPGRYGCVILCFGEIDCRLHILKHALTNDVTIEDSVERVVARYMTLVDELRRKYDIPVLLWGPVASAPETAASYNPIYPSIGSNIERNHVTVLFAEKIRAEAGRRKGVAQFDILDVMIDESMGTRPGFLFDECHVGARALPTAEKRLRSCLETLGLQRLLPTLERLPRMTSRRRIRNIADGLRYRVSSEMPGVPTHPFIGEPSPWAKFHTMLEPQPWILFDFGDAHLLDEVVVYNRSVERQDRAKWLHVLCSLDGKKFATLYEPAEPIAFGGVIEGTPCRIKIPDGVLARFLKLELRDETYFHLDFVQVFAFSFLADRAVPIST